MRRSALLVLLLCTVTVMFSACRSARPSCKPGLAAAVEALSRGKPFSLVGMEFDDFGVDCEQTQLAAVLGQIKKSNELAGDNGAVVFVYVHGWHHGAMTKNLTDFASQFLEPIAKEEAERTKGKPRPIVGVYVAWRGARWTNWPDYLPASYYDRSDAGVRIGTTGALEALTAIMAGVNRNDQSRSVFIGHSMGGLIVERAFTTAMRSYISKEADRHREFVWNPPADLIITINAAAPAMEAWRFKRTLDEWKVHLQPRTSPYAKGDRPWRPLIASITSEGDWATSSVMAAAAWLRTRGVDVGQQRSVLRPLSHEDERRLLLYSAGFSCKLLTHVVVKEPAVLSETLGSVTACIPDYLHDTAPAALNWKVRAGALECDVPRLHRSGDPRACFEVGTDRFRFLEIADSTISDPSRGDRSLYWIMRVPNDVVKEHSGIFTLRSRGLIRGLLSLTEAIAASKSEAPTDPRPYGNTAEGRASYFAAESLRTRTFGIQTDVAASVESPGSCVLPDKLGFSFSGQNCAGKSGGDSVCDAGTEVTFRIDPPVDQATASAMHGPDTLSVRPCATIEWRFGEEIREGAVVPFVIRKATPALVSMKSDRGERTATAWIAVSPVPDQVFPTAPRVRFAGVESGCSPEGGTCRTGETIEFEATVGPSSEVPMRFEWDFGKGPVHGSRVRYVFSDARPHRVVAKAVTRLESKLIELTVPVVSCAEPPPALRIRYRGLKSGCSDFQGECVIGETVRYSLEPSDIPCGVVEWNGVKSGRSPVERALRGRTETVVASLTTAGGVSTASVTVRAGVEEDDRELTRNDVPCPDGSIPKCASLQSVPPLAPQPCTACCTFSRGISGEHVVASGEWLSSIAWQYYRTFDWSRIYDANRTILGRRHPDLIFPGEKLKIPLCASQPQ